MPLQDLFCKALPKNKKSLLVRDCVLIKKVLDIKYSYFILSDDGDLVALHGVIVLHKHSKHMTKLPKVINYSVKKLKFE